jgi:hypothetical protein
MKMINQSGREIAPDLSVNVTAQSCAFGSLRCFVTPAARSSNVRPTPNLYKAYVKNFVALFLLAISLAASADELMPSAAQKAESEKIFRGFIGAIKEARYADAYLLQTESMKRLIPLAQWSDMEAAFRARAGSNPQFGNVVVHWFKDPPGAEAPGIYALFEYECRYENLILCRGGVMLHSLRGDTFAVMRHERTTSLKEASSGAPSNIPLNRPR